MCECRVCMSAHRLKSQEACFFLLQEHVLTCESIVSLLGFVSLRGQSSSTVIIVGCFVQFSHIQLAV